MWTIFKVFIEFVTILLRFYVLVFWPRGEASGILAPRSGIEPEPPAVEARGLNHWTTREVSTIPVLITVDLCVICLLSASLARLQLREVRPVSVSAPALSPQCLARGKGSIICAERENDKGYHRSMLG